MSETSQYIDYTNVDHNWPAFLTIVALSYLIIINLTGNFAIIVDGLDITCYLASVCLIGACCFNNYMYHVSEQTVKTIVATERTEFNRQLANHVMYKAHKYVTIFLTCANAFIGYLFGLQLYGSVITLAVGGTIILLFAGAFVNNYFQLD